MRVFYIGLLYSSTEKMLGLKVSTIIEPKVNLTRHSVKILMTKHLPVFFMNKNLTINHDCFSRLAG